jgi:hypothetical protein
VPLPGAGIDIGARPLALNLPLRGRCDNEHTKMAWIEGGMQDGANA